MNKIAALGLAATMAAGAMMVSGQASADYWPHPMHHHHSNFYFGSPFFFGFSVGPQFRYMDPYPRYYGYSNYGYSDLHVQWCLGRYRTYNPATNTFFIKKGVPAVCVSPYTRY
jgi:BA14K-like protein